MPSTLSYDHIALAVIAGILPLLFIPELPSLSFWWLLAAISLILACYRTYSTHFIALLLLSFLWATLVADRLSRQVEHFAGQTAFIQGRVVEANIGMEQNNGVLFLVTNVNGQDLSIDKRLQLPLYFSGAQKPLAQRMYAGQQWQGSVEFRAVHSRLNQGGDDRQRWAMANHQPLTAHVKEMAMIDTSNSWRQRFISKTVALTASNATQDILLALAFGERGMMQQERRQIFLQTGTAHLMAISGLHIGLAALFGWSVARAIQFTFSVNMIGQRFPLIVGWVVAAIYVWLSGGNPPALRAFLALTMWTLLRWQSVNWTSWQVWLRIIAILLIIDPLMVLSDSLWLSCIAVAALIFWFQWVPLPNRISRRYRPFALWISIQIAMVVLLMPIQAVLFHGLSWTAMLGNLIAVPVVSFITLPTILVGLIASGFPSISLIAWWVADQSLLFVLFFLQKMQHGWLFVPSQALLISFIGWALILCWRLSLWRCGLFTPWLVLLVALMPFWQKKTEKWRVDLLDVGHGLAIAIRKDNHVILYDTGNRWETGSMAEREILPFLRWHNLVLEGIILSHQHTDHAGGLADLQNAFPNAWLRSSTLLQGDRCQQGDNWQWHGLNFHVLWPLQQVESAGNPESCVVRVSDGRYSVLLTGDLEKAQEFALVKQFGNALQSDIVQTPHHGSKTSSSISFIQAVNPQLSLTSAARYNPWRLPAKAIEQRYKDAGIQWVSTAESGQSSVLFYDNEYYVMTLREHLMPRWYHRRFGS